MKAYKLRAGENRNWRHEGLILISALGVKLKIKLPQMIRLNGWAVPSLVLAWSVLPAGLAPRAAAAEEVVPWVSALEGKSDTFLIQRGGGDEWFRATLNIPIKTADTVWLEAGGRAEVFLNEDSWVRLFGPAGLRFDTLEPKTFDLAQNLGPAIYQTGSESRIYLVTPKLGITVHPNSRVRVSVAADEATEVTTPRGEAELNGPAGYAAVRPGQSLFLAAGAVSYHVSAAPPADEFDQWSQQRDQKLAAAAAPPAPTIRYLPPPVAYDLAYYGVWVNDPVYGWCWRPRVIVAGWAPYRVGRWMWEPGWGWTWISLEPWGWYPYHYGRWVITGSGWLWVPAPFVAVAWSPAVVFWLDGPDWIGWCPIPPQVDLVLVRRNPPLVYKYVAENNITVVKVADFNQTNYIRYHRPLPRNFREQTVPGADPKHEFRHFRETREFMTPEPAGWVKPERRPPAHLAERVPPVWERTPRPETKPSGPPEKTGIITARPTPPGRGRDRTPPAQTRESAPAEHGRGYLPPPARGEKQIDRSTPPARQEKAGEKTETRPAPRGPTPPEIKPARPAPPRKEPSVPLFQEPKPERPVPAVVPGGTRPVGPSPGKPSTPAEKIKSAPSPAPSALPP